MSHWTDRYVGIPYRDSGRDRAGLDCWGLVRLVYAEQLAIELPSYGEISARELARIASLMSDGAASDPWRAVDLAAARCNDVLVMRHPTRRMTGHVGVMIDASHVMHIWESTDVIVQPVTDYLISRRIVGLRRHKDVV